MARRWHLTLVAALALASAACTRSRAQSRITDGPLVDLKAAASAHYQAYGRALSTPQRGALAGFYHRDGALIVFNGVARRESQAELRRRYEGPWRPPAYFIWENLVFDSISTNQVMVTGGFRWQAPGQQDTLRFIYASLLVAVDSGMAIVFEHETLRPRP